MLALRTIAAVAGWLACVVGAAAEMPLIGPAMVAAMLVAYSATLADPLRQFRPVLIVGVVGTFLESVWIALGAYAPSDAMRGSLLCPLWITALWLNAAVFVQGSGAGKSVSWRRTALVGAVLTPIAYALAAGLGAIFVAWPPLAALPAAAAYGAVVVPAVAWLMHGSQARFSSGPSQTSQESNHG